MSLFKLYCQFNLNKDPVYKELIDIKYIESVTPFYFGLNIDVNTAAYKVYEKKTMKKFLKGKVESFFVTEKKFEEIIEQASLFNMKVKNTKFIMEPDEYNFFEDRLFRQDISNREILDYIIEVKDQGVKLKSLTLSIDGKNDLIFLYSNGCIYISNDEMAQDELFKKFLEYLLTGRRIR